MHHGSTEGTEDSPGEQQNLLLSPSLFSVPSVFPW